MILCPVMGCKKSFLNKYSLTNHVRKSIELEHKNYYEKYIKIKGCSNCNTRLDNRRKLINAEGLCHTCFKNKYPKELKKIEKIWQIKKCYGCGRDVEGLFSNRNTRVLCDFCKPISIVRKKNYNKNFDKIRYENDRKNRLNLRKFKDNHKLDELYTLIRQDLLEKDIPIYKLCEKYNISLLSIRKVLPLIMADSDYKERNHQIRSRAVQLRIEDLRNFLKNRPNPRKIIRTPTSIEKKIGEEIKLFFPESEIRYNVWKTLRDEPNNCYLHLESDIIINFNNIRIIILSDGEAFHGVDCYFNGDTVKEDDRRSKILYQNNPFVLRYSETEIKKGIAVTHIIKIIQDILSKNISSYYRNWMTGEEIIIGILHDPALP
jgi:hypothetical protein